MLKVNEICQYTGGGAIQPYDDFAVAGVSTDSRDIKPGEVFIALEGESFNGHDFCRDAVNKGAKVLVVSRLPGILPDGVVVIVVKDTLKAYQDIAACYRRKFTLPVIAVTGSAGKTSTKDLIAAALSTSKRVLKSQGNHNNEIGLPLTLLHLADCYDAAIVEMAMRGLGQIRELSLIARPDIAVVTNVGQTHIELLGSEENIAAAKRELIEELPPDGAAVLNYDNRLTREMAAAVKGRSIFYGLGAGADIRASDIRRENTRTVFSCGNKITNEIYDVDIPFLGEHNVYNTLAAIAVCTVLGADREKMLAGLARAELSGMRQELSEVAGILFMDDTYNASPASMRAALRTLSLLPGRRKIAVLGDMLELGDITEEAHRQLGRDVAGHGIDILVTVGENAGLISAEAAGQGVFCQHFKERYAAVLTLENLLAPGDAVLFKGSRGMRMEEMLCVLKEKRR